MTGLWQPTEPDGPPSYTCPRCAMTTHHPDDVREGYCGNCHDWTRATHEATARYLAGLFDLPARSIGWAAAMHTTRLRDTAPE